MTNADQVSILDRGIELAPAKLLTIEGFTYVEKDKTVTLFKPPMGVEIEVTTLAGLVDLLEAKIDEVDAGKIIVHVESFERVSVLSTNQDVFGRRRAYVVAKLMKQDRQFQFNTFIDQESFNIGLRSLFVPDKNVHDLLLTSGNLAKQQEARQEDDGVTQRITVKAGISLVADKVVVPRVTLAPYRTFREALQPPSDFVFRVKCSEDRGNQCALFEADGGYWKIAAMANVKEWLSNRLKGSISLADIPVIS